MKPIGSIEDHNSMMAAHQLILITFTTLFPLLLHVEGIFISNKEGYKSLSSNLGLIIIAWLYSFAFIMPFTLYLSLIIKRDSRTLTCLSHNFYHIHADMVSTSHMKCLLYIVANSIAFKLHFVVDSRPTTTLHQKTTELDSMKYVMAFSVKGKTALPL